MISKLKLLSAIALSLSTLLATPVMASFRPPENHFGGGATDIHFTNDSPAASHLFGDVHHAYHHGVLVGGETHIHTAPTGYHYGDFLGVLNVGRLNRNVNIYAGATMEAMDKGAGHFSFTGLDGGNVGLIGHNRGQRNGFFSFLRLLHEGDRLTLTRGGTTRTFVVSHSFIVSETDFAPLQQFGDNRLTLVTCVEYQQTQRRVVVALEV